MKKFLVALLSLMILGCLMFALTGCVYFDTHKHQLTHVKAVSATCTEDGTIEYWQCEVCKKDYSDKNATDNITNVIKTISATGHSYSQKVTQATCLEDGYTTYTCRVCGDVYKAEETKALGHDWETPTYTFATDYSTCVAKKVCKNDGEVVTETVICDLVVSTPATETSFGQGAFVATFKDQSFETQKYDVDVSLDNLAFEKTVYTWTGIVDGVLTYNASCYLTKTCITDASRTINAVAKITSSINKEPTCTEEGIGLYVADFINPAFELQYAKVTLPANGHTLTTTYSPATCTEDGFSMETCSVCDYERKFDEIPALGHDIVLHEAKDPTCTTIGWGAYETCNRSYCDYSTYVEIPALGHSMVEVEAQDPTCTEVGWYAYQYCEHEGCLNTTYVEIPALGHDLIDVEAQDPTCTEVGWYAYQYCNREGCDYSTYVEIPALGHDYVEHQGCPATCEEDGWKDYVTCSRCDYTTYEVIYAFGHDYEVTITPATCEGAGLIYYTCQHDNSHVYFEVLSPLGHIGGEATCINKAVCDRCNNEYGELLPHNYTFNYDLGEHENCSEGYMVYATCSLCNRAFSWEANGHIFEAHDISFKEDGGKTIYIFEERCSICGYVSSLVVDDNNCTWVSTDEVEDGYTVYKCATCGAIKHYRSETVKNGCQIERTFAYKYFIGGKEVYNVVYTHVSEAHNYQYTYEGDCENGYIVIGTCNDCGNVERSEEVQYGHKYVDGVCEICNEHQE